MTSRRNGSSAATFRRVPRAASSAGPEAVELAASAGLILDDWQQDVLCGALGERKDGSWSAFEVGVVVPRQNGKGSILEARELAGLFLFGDRLILHSAHEFKTAQEAFLRLLRLVQDTPDLDRLVQRVRTSHGEEGIELKDGARIRFVARSTGSGRGFTGDCVVLDEAYNLSSKAISALLPTMAARSKDGNPQLWYTSSAPLPDPVSDVLRRVCRRGRAGKDRRLAYWEWCADLSKHGLGDKAGWKAANPGFGHRITAEFIGSELAALEEADFARERLGVWPDGDDSGRPIGDADWLAVQVDARSTVLADPVTFALDVTPNRGAGALCVAGDCDGRPVVEVVDARRGTGWVVDRVVDVTSTHPNRGVVIDSASQAGSFVDELTRAGVRVVEVSLSDHKRACAGFFDAVLGRDVGVVPSPRLDAAVAGATQRNVGDAWLWNRRAGADISPLVASTLALWGHRLPVDEDPVMALPEVVVL